MEKVLYQAYKSNIKNGDLLAFRGKGLKAYLIRTFTRSEYSHVGIAYNPAGRVLMLDTIQNTGVRLSPVSQLLHCQPVVIHTKINWEAQIEELAFAEFGKEYSTLDALRASLGLKTKSCNGWQCAEYVCAVLKKAGLNLKGILPGTLVQDVLNAVPGSKEIALLDKKSLED